MKNLGESLNIDLDNDDLDIGPDEEENKRKSQRSIKWQKKQERFL